MIEIGIQPNVTVGRGISGKPLIYIQEFIVEESMIEYAGEFKI